MATHSHTAPCIHEIHPPTCIFLLKRSVRTPTPAEVVASQGLGQGPWPLTREVEASGHREPPVCCTAGRPWDMAATSMDTEARQLGPGEELYRAEGPLVSLGSQGHFPAFKTLPLWRQAEGRTRLVSQLGQLQQQGQSRAHSRSDHQPTGAGTKSRGAGLRPPAQLRQACTP